MTRKKKDYPMEISMTKKKDYPMEISMTKKKDYLMEIFKTKLKVIVTRKVAKMMRRWTPLSL